MKIYANTSHFNIHIFLKHLREAFEDNECRTKIYDCLSNFKQRDKNFHEILSEFNQFSLEVKEDQWSEVIKEHMLRNVINVKLTDRMSIVQEFDTLKEYCDLLTRIANRMKEIE